jgi:hypothetical protein
MVRFFEIAAPVLIVAYAATYMAMRYLFPPEVRRWGVLPIVRVVRRWLLPREDT